jgi:hypothetical protein
MQVCNYYHHAPLQPLKLYTIYIFAVGRAPCTASALRHDAARCTQYNRQIPYTYTSSSVNSTRAWYTGEQIHRGKAGGKMTSALILNECITEEGGLGGVSHVLEARSGRAELCNSRLVRVSIVAQRRRDTVQLVSPGNEPCRFVGHLWSRGSRGVVRSICEALAASAA